MLCVGRGTGQVHSWNGRRCCGCLYLTQLSTKWVVSGEDRVAANVFVRLVNLHGVQAGLSPAVCPQSPMWDAGGLLTLPSSVFPLPAEALSFCSKSPDLSGHGSLPGFPRCWRDAGL